MNQITLNLFYLKFYLCFDVDCRLKWKMSQSGRRVGAYGCWSGSTEESWNEEKENENVERNLKVPFFPMPKELQVLMQTKRGDCYLKKMIILLYGILYWNKTYYCNENENVVTRKQIVPNLCWDHKPYSLQPI